MQVYLTANKYELGQCRECDWHYTIDDTEFPSEYVFIVSYKHLSNDEVFLMGIRPSMVSVRSTAGSPLYDHVFTPSQASYVKTWIIARLFNRRAHARLRDSIEQAIREHIEHTSLAAAELFAELAEGK